MERDLGETRGALDDAMRDRANIEKNCKMTQGSIVEANQKMDELARALNEADSTKKKLIVEALDLSRQIEETENAIAALGKSDTLRALSKAQAEIQLWKSKFETEALGRIDELEGNKSKLGARVNESEETIDSLNTKIGSAEKSKLRMESELEELSMEYER